MLTIFGSFDFNREERVFGLPRRSSSEVCQSELSSLTSIIGGER